eukprot:m.643023 g.643023  ORF g.643023 m.643023 type:complete len:131 (-) comp22642_c1_seq27:2010-2402(-)
MFFTNALDTVKFHVDFLAGFELGNKNVVMHRRYTVRAKVFQLIALWDPDEVTRHDAVVGVHARGIIVSRDHVRTPLALHSPTMHTVAANDPDKKFVAIRTRALCVHVKTARDAPTLSIFSLLSGSHCIPP